MPSKKTSRLSALAPLALALALVSMSCASAPSAPPEPPPIAWPVLLPPPDGIALDAEGRVLVPLDYWLGLVEYVRRVDDVRAILARENRLLGGKE